MDNAGRGAVRHPWLLFFGISGGETDAAALFAGPERALAREAVLAASHHGMVTALRVMAALSLAALAVAQFRIAKKEG